MSASLSTTVKDDKDIMDFGKWHSEAMFPMLDGSCAGMTRAEYSMGLNDEYDDEGCVGTKEIRDYYSNYTNSSGDFISGPVRRQAIRYTCPFNRQTIIPVTNGDVTQYWPANFVNFTGTLPNRNNSYLVSGERSDEQEYLFWKALWQNNISSLVAVAGIRDQEYRIGDGETKEISIEGAAPLKIKCELIDPATLGVTISDYWKDSFKVRKHTITDTATGQEKAVYHFCADGEKGGDPVNVPEQVLDIKTESSIESDHIRSKKYLSGKIYQRRVARAQHNVLNFVKHIQDCQNALGVYEDLNHKTYVHCAQGLDRTGVFLNLYHMLSVARRHGDRLDAELVKSSLDATKTARMIEATTASGAAVNYMQRKLTTVDALNAEMSLLKGEPFLSHFSNVLCNVALGKEVDYGVPQEPTRDKIFASNRIHLRIGEAVYSVSRSGIADFSQLQDKLTKMGIVNAENELQQIHIAGTPTENILQFNEQTPGNVIVVPRIEQDDKNYSVKFKDEKRAEAFHSKSFSCEAVKQGDFFVCKVDKELFDISSIKQALQELYNPPVAAKVPKKFDVKELFELIESVTPEKAVNEEGLVGYRLGTAFDFIIKQGDSDRYFIRQVGNKADMDEINDLLAAEIFQIFKEREQIIKGQINGVIDQWIFSVASKYVQEACDSRDGSITVDNIQVFPDGRVINLDSGEEFTNQKQKLNTLLEVGAYLEEVADQKIKLSALSSADSMSVGGAGSLGNMRLERMETATKDASSENPAASMKADPDLSISLKPMGPAQNTFSA